MIGSLLGSSKMVKSNTKNTTKSQFWKWRKLLLWQWQKLPREGADNNLEWEAEFGLMMKFLSPKFLNPPPPIQPTPSLPFPPPSPSVMLTPDQRRADGVLACLVAEGEISRSACLSLTRNRIQTYTDIHICTYTYTYTYKTPCLSPFGDISFWQFWCSQVHVMRLHRKYCSLNMGIATPPLHTLPLWDMHYPCGQCEWEGEGGWACNGNSLLEAHKVISSQAMPQLSICMQWWLSHKVAPGVVDFYCALAVSTPGWCDGGVLQLSELMARPAISRVPRWILSCGWLSFWG